MISSVIALMAAGLAAASDGSTANQPTASATPQPAVASPPVKDDSEKVVCRTMTPTGSRLGGQRVCKTGAEWSEINRNARTMVQNAQMNGMTSGVKGN